MIKKSVLKQVGIVLAVLVVVAAVILLLTLVINGPSRMLTSEELALEQTRIAHKIFIKQTEVALTSTAGLYLTLGVPFPTETPFIVPTNGSLGQKTLGIALENTPQNSTRTNSSNTSIIPSTINTTVASQPQITLTPTVTSTPTKTAEPSSDLFKWWEGEWKAYYSDLGALTGGFLSITVTGDLINGSVGFFDEKPRELSGKISVNGQQVTGNYSGENGSGQFYWQRQDNYHFGGNLNGMMGMCASRSGDVNPDRCLIMNSP